MARGTAAELHLHLEWGEVELVVEGGEILEVELVETQGFGDRAAAVVHEGLRHLDQNPMATDAAFRDEAAELLLPGTEAVHLGDDVGRHEPDIVPVQRIFAAGISETDPELHLPLPLAGGGEPQSSGG